MKSVSLTDVDLLIINNALNEILNGPEAIDNWEFQTRVGVNRELAVALLERIGNELEDRNAS